MSRSGAWNRPLSVRHRLNSANNENDTPTQGSIVRFLTASSERRRAALAARPLAFMDACDTAQPSAARSASASAATSSGVL